MTLAEFPAPLSQTELAEEIPHVTLWENGKGIQYDIIRRPNNTFDRIYFGQREDSTWTIEVMMATGGEWPVFRPYTPEEMMQFMEIAVLAYPKEQITLDLCRFIRDQADSMSEIAKMHIALLEVHPAPRPI